MSDVAHIEVVDLRKVYPRRVLERMLSVAFSSSKTRNSRNESEAALAGINLSIKHGDRLGIIGRNGAGKSTLLQILAGVIQPTSGSVSVVGTVTAVLTLGVGLREDLTGRDNIYLDFKSRGEEGNLTDAIITEIIEFADLGEFIDMPLRTYSTGMKARLAFSMITQLMPEILIIDEALSVGDAEFSVKAGQRITELCSRGAIVIIVSHGMDSIKKLCNRCVWMEDGKLVMDGVPDKVCAAYLDSIRKADDEDLIERFRGLSGAKTLVSGYEMSPLEFRSEGIEISKIEECASLQVSCAIPIEKRQAGHVFTVSCVRLDGVLISESTFNIALGKDIISLLYPTFNLYQGIYMIKISWKDHNGIGLAESTRVLEVISAHVMAGGRPVLVATGTVFSTAVEPIQ